MRIESGDEGVVAARWDSALLIAAGWDPYALVDAAVAEAARLSGDHRARVHALRLLTGTFCPGMHNMHVAGTCFGRLACKLRLTLKLRLGFYLGAGSTKPRGAKTLPKFVDVFGWCTWDAFYSRVSAEGSPQA